MQKQLAWTRTSYELVQKSGVGGGLRKEKLGQHL